MYNVIRTLSILSLAVWYFLLLDVHHIALAEVVFRGEKMQVALELGAPVEQIIDIIGKPTKRNISGNRETWYYGKSILFVRDLKLVAWSDSGELSALTASLREKRKSAWQKRQARKDWRNPWTPKEHVNTEKLIDDLLLPRRGSAGSDSDTLPLIRY